MKYLIAIQEELKAPKGKYNSFGKYNYRSCEDILEAVKPICHKHGCVLTLSDKPIQVGDRYYIEAEACLRTPDTVFHVTASARESEDKKGMDASQITGTASSYARKYALNGLFNIDDTKDADTDEYKHESEEIKKKNEGRKKSSAKQYDLSKDELMDKVVALCDAKRLRVSDICKMAKVSELSELSEDRLQSCIDYIFQSTK